ncbi:hypothetical protein AB0H20_09535 [Nocardia fluminea]|uniref:hypothetical protein n=1 Tax=Nocardia fluminea TaxID=134984 RepID=UPI0033F96784
MTVSEFDRIDQMFRRPDGRLVLAMNEERPYGGPDSHLLDNDFRIKINGYINAVRSGFAQSLAGGDSETAGIEIVLFSRTMPSEVVLNMIDRVNKDLSVEGIGASWESIASEDLGTGVLEQALVDESVRLAGADFKLAVMWVALVGRDGAAGIKVERKDGSVENIQASNRLRSLLAEHKRISIDRSRGTWLCGIIRILSVGNYKSQFTNSHVPEWIPQPSNENLRLEIEAFPRESEEVSNWIRDRIGDLWN